MGDKFYDKLVKGEEKLKLCDVGGRNKKFAVKSMICICIFAFRMLQRYRKKTICRMMIV
jgi:hypothetical protein